MLGDTVVAWLHLAAEAVPMALRPAVCAIRRAHEPEVVRTWRPSWRAKDVLFRRCRYCRVDLDQHGEASR